MPSLTCFAVSGLSPWLTLLRDSNVLPVWPVHTLVVAILTVSSSVTAHSRFDYFHYGPQGRHQPCNIFIPEHSCKTGRWVTHRFITRQDCSVTTDPFFHSHKFLIQTAMKKDGIKQWVYLQFLKLQITSLPPPMHRWCEFLGCGAKVLPEWLFGYYGKLLELALPQKSSQMVTGGAPDSSV